MLKRNTKNANSNLQIYRFKNLKYIYKFAMAFWGFGLSYINRKKPFFKQEVVPNPWNALFLGVGGLYSLQSSISSSHLNIFHH